MLHKAEITNKEQVLQWYISRDNSCFIVCTGTRLDGKQIFCKYLGEDGVLGQEKLLTGLDFISNNASNSNTYTMVSFPWDENIENVKIKDIEGETIRFQFNSSYYANNQSVGAVSVASVSEATQDQYGKALLLMLQKQNDSLMQRLDYMQSQLEKEEDEEYEEEEEPQPLTGKERLIGAIAGIVERPEFTETIFGVVGMVLNKFITPKENSNGSEQRDTNTNGAD